MTLMANKVPLRVWVIADHSQDLFGVRLRWGLVAAVMMMVFATGLGIRMTLALPELKSRDYAKVESFVRATIHPSDVVLADYQAFYPLHELNATAYYSWYFHVMTEQEAAAINCHLIDPAWLPTAESKIGGGWHATGESFLNVGKFNIAWLDQLLPDYLYYQTNLKYNLAVYRRR